jgi:hypothetical protein
MLLEEVGGDAGLCICGMFFLVGFLIVALWPDYLYGVGLSVVIPDYRQDL